MHSTPHLFASVLAFAAVVLGSGFVLALVSGCSVGRPAFSGATAPLSPSPGDSSVAIHVSEERGSLAARRKRGESGHAVAAKGTGSSTD